MKSPYFFILLSSLFLVTNIAEGQKILQVERSGRKKVQKYYIGDILHFKLKGENLVYNLPIRNMDDRTGTLFFDNGSFNIHQIGEIVVQKNQRAVRAWKITFINFGVSWGVLTIVDLLAGGAFNWGAVIVTGGAIVVGYLVKLLFSKRKLKLGKKRALRILNLNISPADFVRPAIGGA